MDRMGDMRDIITGRSPMRRARPLFLRLNEWRRKMEEEEVRPGRGRGPGDWYKREICQGKRVPGGRDEPDFLGRGRSYPALETLP